MIKEPSQQELELILKGVKLAHKALFGEEPTIIDTQDTRWSRYYCPLNPPRVIAGITVTTIAIRVFLGKNTNGDWIAFTGATLYNITSNPLSKKEEEVLFIAIDQVLLDAQSLQKFFCNKCHGKGCDHCHYQGKFTGKAFLL